MVEQLVLPYLPRGGFIEGEGGFRAGGGLGLPGWLRWCVGRLKLTVTSQSPIGSAAIRPRGQTPPSQGKHKRADKRGQYRRPLSERRERRQHGRGRQAHALLHALEDGVAAWGRFRFGFCAPVRPSLGRHGAWGTRLGRLPDASPPLMAAKSPEEPAPETLP